MKLNENTIVVVTGAGSGIGEAMASKFAAQHCTVVVADVDVTAAEADAGRIARAGGTAVAERVDVTDQESVESLAKRVYERFGRVDLLCCNAGVSMRPFRATWDASRRDYQWLMEVNYFGFVNSILSFVPRMRPQSGERRVVVTSSVTALDVPPGHAPYASTKAAVTALADGLRAELAETTSDFGVTTIFPGYVPTKITTSERFRPTTEQSATRQIAPFVSKRPIPEYDLPVDVDFVSQRILDAVLSDAPTCLTHPYPAEAVEARVAEFRAADPGRAGFRSNERAAEIH